MELTYTILLVAGICLLLGSATFAMFKYFAGLYPNSSQGQRRASEVANPMFLMPQTPKSAMGSSPSSKKPEKLPSAEVIIRTFLTPTDGQPSHKRMPSSGSGFDDTPSPDSIDSVPPTPDNANFLSSLGKASQPSIENRRLSQQQVFPIWRQNPIASARQNVESSEKLNTASLAGDNGECGKSSAMESMQYLGDVVKPQVCF